jgi:cytochrome c1
LGADPHIIADQDGALAFDLASFLVAQNARENKASAATGCPVVIFLYRHVSRD